MAQRIISGTPYHNVSAALSQNVGTQGANSQDAKTQPAYRTATVYNNYIKKSALIPKAISLFIDYVRHDFQKAELTIQGGGGEHIGNHGNSST
jgi:hypothetical protein